MKNNTKSSITLPPLELKLVDFLMRKLGAKSKVEVVRKGLQMLKDSIERESLRSAFHASSMASRKFLTKEIKDLDHLTDEGLDS